MIFLFDLDDLSRLPHDVKATIFLAFRKTIAHEAILFYKSSNQVSCVIIVHS